MTDPKVLLPCPFCGGINLYADRYEHGSGQRWRVVCLDCMGMVDPGTIQQKYRAIETWNRRAGGWIPVEERLPEATDGNYAGLILVFSDGWKMNTVPVQRMLQLQAEGGWNITHWMPLPEAPERG